MCGRLTQYRGIHDFVAVLSIPDALINHVGDAPVSVSFLLRENLQGMTTAA